MAHECSQPLVWRAIKNAWVHCPHCPQMSTHGARTHGAWHRPASERVMWTLPTLPPTKVLMAIWPPARWPHGRAPMLAAWLRAHVAPLAAGHLAGMAVCFRHEAPGEGPGQRATAAEGPQTKFFIAHIAHTTHRFFYVYWRRWLVHVVAAEKFAPSLVIPHQQPARSVDV